MLTPRQAFKYGFLQRCAEEGLSAEEITGRIKQALDPMSVVSGPANFLTRMGLYGLAASAVGGAGIGYGAAKLTAPDADPEEARLRELQATYQMYAENARRNAAKRSYRPGTIR